VKRGNHRTTCPTGKAQYMDFQPASYAAARFNQKHGKPESMVLPYFCDKCMHWHTGHPPGTKLKKEVRK